MPALFSVIGAAVFTRIFSPSEYGVFSLILAVTGPVTTVVTEWAAQPIGRFYAEYARRRRLTEYWLVVSSLAHVVVIGMGIAALLVALVLTLVEAHASTWNLAAAAVALVTAQGIVAVALPTLPARMQPRPYAIVVVALAVLSTVLPMLMIWWWGPNVVWLIWGQALARVLVLPYLYSRMVVRPVLLSEVRAPYPAHMIRRFVRYGAPMTGWMLAAGLLNVGDRYVIQAALGSEAVGIYSVNYGLVAMTVGFISGAVTTAAFPILMQLWAQQRFEDARRTLSTMTDIYLLLGVALVGGVAVVGRPLVEVLLGSGFSDGYVIHVPVVIGSVIWGVSILGQKGLEFAEHTKYMVVHALVAATLNVALNLIFVPRFGYLAAAYTTLSSYLLYTTLIWLQTQRHVPWVIPVRGVAASAAAGVGAYVVARYVVPLATAPLGAVFLGGVAFVVAYAAFLAVLRFGDLRSMIRPRSAGAT